MKTLVAISSVKSNSNYHYIGDMNFGTIKIPFGIIEVGKPKFDTSLSENDDYVLLQVKAISCNYRDKAILIENYKKFKKRIFHTRLLVLNFVPVLLVKGLMFLNLKLEKQ
ncbi:hypothetical protein IF703_14520 (plasmid) [Staphylococcus aureus]|uniref:hypothetical protein n=1 Tax=Staphylococcus aureus TaxID=1280 RepID=UPI001EFF497B|nr:hypothetical protein [Staphylococcus aureus]ULW45170.1 hypothetical protein IF703_14520 [Staphylococcus aureus]